MVTARCWRAGSVMAESSQTPPAPDESVSAAGAARLQGTGVDPTITGEPPEERADKDAGTRRGLSLTRTGRVGPSQPQTRAVVLTPSHRRVSVRQARWYRGAVQASSS